MLAPSGCASGRGTSLARQRARTRRRASSEICRQILGSAKPGSARLQTLTCCKSMHVMMHTWREVSARSILAALLRTLRKRRKFHARAQPETRMATCNGSRVRPKKLHGCVALVGLPGVRQNRMGALDRLAWRCSSLIANGPGEFSDHKFCHVCQDF